MIGTSLLHYRVTELLGQGGMGEVWLAEDTKLGREVALKVLPAELADSPERRERLEREARAVAALDHPNVVTLFALEEDDGLLFLTMERVRGLSLSESIPEGGLELERFFNIAVQLADGLAAAHERNIVHRDLKPANVMVTDDGRVKILDFGLARWEPGIQTSDEAPTEAAITGEGQAPGTVPYMSPEQLQGKIANARSDIFSLGAVLYRALSGERPFKGDSSVETMSAILRDEPPTVTEIRSALPNHLGRIVKRCLEKDPERRYQSAKDVRNELARLREEIESARGVASTDSSREKEASGLWRWAAAGLAVLVAVAGTTFWLGRSPSEEPPPAQAGSDRQLIVVLPLENLGAPEDDYFALGITDELRTRLTSVDGLGVISRKSALAYAERGWTVAQLGDELGVDWVLEGSVRWARDSGGASRVKVSPQLIRVADDTQVWASAFERAIEDVFEVQEEIAEQVLGNVGLALGRRRAGAELTENPEAYNAYLRGLEVKQRPGFSPRDMVLAAELFEQAARLDPEFSPAWAELAMAHAQVYHYGIDRSMERAAAAHEAATQAEALAPESPAASSARGMVLYHVDHDYERALPLIDRALEARPGDPELYFNRAVVLRRDGRWEEAKQAFNEAFRLDSRWADAIQQVGQVHWFLNEFEEAERAFDSALELAPGGAEGLFWKEIMIFHRQGSEAALEFVERAYPAEFELSRLCQSWWYLHSLGRYEEALAQINAIPGEGCTGLAWVEPKALLRGLVLHFAPEPDESRQELRKAVGLLEQERSARPEDDRAYASLGIAYALLGDRDRALDHARRALELNDPEHDAYEGPGRIWTLARVHAILGDVEESLDLVEETLAMPSGPSERDLLENPEFRLLEGHPRYEALVADFRDA